MGEAWTVDNFLVRAAVEIPGGARNLGWDFDRDWVLVRTASEMEVGGACPTTTGRFDAISASDGGSGVRDGDADNVTDGTLGVDSALDAGREIIPVLDAGRDADSVFEASRDADDRGVDLDADHGRDMSKRRDSDGSFSFSLSFKGSLKELKNEDVRACALDDTAADADCPAKCL
jgi:hypothetical protein